MLCIHLNFLTYLCFPIDTLRPFKSALPNDTKRPPIDGLRPFKGLNLLMFCVHLTRLSQMDVLISIDRTTVFQILGVLGGIFHFFKL